MVAQALTDYNQEHIQFTASKKNVGYYENNLLAFFGRMFVSDITQGKINQFVREHEEKGMSNGTIRRFLEHLQGALNWAEREQRLLYVPKFKKPPAPAPRDNVLSFAQVKKLKAAAVSPHIALFIDLMLETGQRPAAIERLKWEQVDFKAGIINFDRTGRRITNKRVRPVAMSTNAQAILSAAKRKAKTAFVLEYDGKPAGCVRKAFERACTKAGIEASRYTLRHTFFNDMDTAGVDEKINSDIGGHTNTKTTRHHYLKTNMQKQKAALDRLAQVRKNSATKKGRRKKK